MTLRFVALFSCVMIFASPVSAQTVLLSDSFTYPNGALVGQGNWTQVLAIATNPIQVSGNAVALNNSGQDVTNDFTGTINSGSAFFGINTVVTKASATGDYFAHFTEQGSTSGFFGRLFAREVSTTTYQFGITTGSGGSPAYGPVLDYGTLARVVVQYNFIDGANNDTAAVFLNPTTDTDTSSPYIAATTTGSTEAGVLGLGQFNLRQGGAATFVTTTVDDLVITSVAPVPEPTTILAVGAGFLAVGATARRLRAGRAVPVG